MRKLLLTLAVLCGTVSAWAQTIYMPGERTTTLEAGKKYFISAATFYSNARPNLLYNNEGTLAYSDKKPTSLISDDAYLFTVEKVGEGNVYYITNNEGKYLQSDNLSSADTETGITIVSYASVKGSVTCGSDVQACDENGNKIEYNNITSATPIVCVYKDNSKGWRHISGLEIGKSTPFAFYEAIKALPEVTTNMSAPILYTIKNVRGNAYATYDGDGNNMKLRSDMEKGTQLFYFTEGSVEGTFKIHNYATNLKCSAVNTWTEDGIDWYIQKSACTTHEGFAISKTKDMTVDGDEAWNDYQNVHTSIAWYGGNDAGSVWKIEKFNGANPGIEVSADNSISNIKLHYIRSNRRNTYVNFDGHNSTFKEGDKGLNSYWYFVQDTEAQKTAPEGFVACRIFNAAHATGVENHSSGYMGDASWPARVYYIGIRENNNCGYIIRRADDENNGWHDFGGNNVGDYGLGDDGSLWRIYPADKTATELQTEAIAQKSQVRNLLDELLSAYYAWSVQDINTAISELDLLSTDKLHDVISIIQNKVYTALSQKERSTQGPVAGDYIQLKNRQYGKFLKANDTNLTSVEDDNNNATLWQVEAGEGTNVKLKNTATGKYIGEIRQSVSVGMVDEANAKQFAFTNYADFYAVFKDITGGNYAYGHIASGNELVGWEPSANATQWVVSKVETPVLPEVGKYYVIECPLFYNVQGVKKALYSDASKPGWKTLDVADKSFYWTVEQTENGYVLKNANDNKYVLGQAENSTEWTMVEATDGAEYTLELAGKGQVFIKITGRHLHANGHGGGSNNSSNIVSWETNAANSASAWKFVETEDPDVVLAKIELKNAIDGVQSMLENCTGEIGYYTTDELPALIATAQAVLDGGSKEVSAYTDALAAFNAGVGALAKVMPAKGQFYRFKHPTVDAYMLSDNYSSSKLAMGTLEQNMTSSVFYYTSEGALLSYAKGQYLPKATQNANWVCLPVASEPPIVTFGSGTTFGRVGFYIGDDSSRAYYSDRKTYVDAGGTFGSNAGYDWVVEKVTTLPVTITSAGYATFFAPVAVEIPEGVEAYYTEEVGGNAVVLTAIEGGVIPANTGVILKGEANTYNFNITADAEAVAGNKLAGTCAAEYVSEDAYVLSKVDGVVGMYKALKNQQGNTSWLNNGFKAYLPATAGGEARFLVFNFGTETGIDELKGENGNVKAEIYDLSGRRVQNAQKGLYIVNGKKVVR